MVARPPQFSPKQIATALQASESSVKRWCDQGAIPTVRTVGGHRRITLDGLQEFLAESNRELQAPQALGIPHLARRREATIPGSDDAIQTAFRVALAEGDEQKCRQSIGQLLQRGSSCSSAAERLITDAMHGIGEAWECSNIDVYQERRACDICIRLINELRAQLPEIAADAPIAIGGTPEGDPYQLPTALVELALREVGWNAISLGHDLPITSFLQAVGDYRPTLVWLSVSSIANPVGFVMEQNRLASQLDDDVSLLVGGRALNDEIRPQLHYTAHCDNLRNMVELAGMLAARG